MFIFVRNETLNSQLATMNVPSSAPISYKGVHPHSAFLSSLINLPAMEEVEVQSFVSDDNVCSETSRDEDVLVNDTAVDSKSARRRFRKEYLRCKRLRMKGFKVPLPVKPWAAPVPARTDEIVVANLSKEELRKIKNRISAQRSRQAVDDSISESTRLYNEELHRFHHLQRENLFLRNLEHSLLRCGVARVENSAVVPLLQQQIAFNFPPSPQVGSDSDDRSISALTASDISAEDFASLSTATTNTSDIEFSEEYSHFLLFNEFLNSMDGEGLSS